MSTALPDVRIDARIGSADDVDPIPPVLERLRCDSVVLFGSPEIRLDVVARVSRPFSQLARVRVAAGRRVVSVFVKVARVRQRGTGEFELMRARVARDYATTVRTFDVMPHQRGFSVVRPIVCYPEHLAIVTEEAPGTTLLQRAEHQLAWWPPAATVAELSAALGRVGQWIEAFQTIEPARPPLLRDGLRAYIDLRLTRLVHSPCGGFTEDDRLHVLRALDRQLDRLDGADLSAVPIHGDLALGNILVDTDRVVVLDLAMTTFGARYYDLAHLYMQLGLLRMKPQFRGRIVRALQQSLLRGYSPATDERQPLFQVSLLQHVACHYLGLVTNGATGLSRAYDRWVARHHLAWLRQYAASDR